MNAYETPEYYFADYGEAVTGDNGKVRVDIDPMFAETVNLSRYMTHVTPTELVCVLLLMKILTISSLKLVSQTY